VQELTAVEAVAEAWAAIDGKLDAYRADEGGHRDGYLSEASELIRNLEQRGFGVERQSMTAEEYGRLTKLLADAPPANNALVDLYVTWMKSETGRLERAAAAVEDAMRREPNLQGGGMTHTIAERDAARAKIAKEVSREIAAIFGLLGRVV
jgi:hypothetical protein